MNWKEWVIGTMVAVGYFVLMAWMQTEFDTVIM